jgi:hypothetical protein
MEESAELKISDRIMGAAPELMQAAEAFETFNNHAFDCGNCEEWGPGNCEEGGRLFSAAFRLNEIALKAALGR